MNLGALKSGAMLAAVTIGGGAAVGAGLGAVRSLNAEPSVEHAGLTATEKRSALANAITGAAVGALGGGTLSVNLPARSLTLPAMLGLGAATGAATFGAYSIGRSVFN